jgi:hypothetical protein
MALTVTEEDASSSAVSLRAEALLAKARMARAKVVLMF